MPKAQHLVDRLPDPQDTILDDKLLSGGDLPLQAADLLECGLVEWTAGGEREEAGDGPGEDGGEAVDDAARVEDDDGAELLAETGEDAELGVVDLGVQGDLDVVADVAVGP